jgi:hypothetical protein
MSVLTRTRLRKKYVAPVEGWAAVAKQFVGAGEWVEYFVARYHRDPIRFHRSYDGHGMLHADELAAEIGLTMSLRAPRF